MTPDERSLLSAFLNDLSSTRGVQKDAEANAMVTQALATNPDAPYLLVQHAIVADQSLHAAQAHISDLEERLRTEAASAAPPSTFLPQPASPWGNPSQPAYSPPPPEERPSIFSGGGGVGSFLRSAGTTAAGVAGGEMLFSGLSGLFGGHSGGGMFGGQGAMGEPRENVVVNNYGNSGDDSGSDDDSSGNDDS